MADALLWLERGFWIVLGAFAAILTLAGIIESFKKWWKKRSVRKYGGLEQATPEETIKIHIYDDRVEGQRS